MLIMNTFNNQDKLKRILQINDELFIDKKELETESKDLTAADIKSLKEDTDMARDLDAKLNALL